jgi:hypothetical protein
MNTRVLSKEDVKLFKGKHYLPWVKSSTEKVILKAPEKVIVFDMDETLGSFGDLYIVWRGIHQVCPECNHFYELLDLYPEFLRYGMLTILEYLYDCKLKKLCHKMFIYTNNQCSAKWVNFISDYLERKIINKSTKKATNNKLFDKIICAFKINNKTIEECRSSHHKKIDDFLKCSLITDNADICFIDDVEYPLMKSSKVYYICPRAYVHHLKTNEIIKRIVCAKWLPLYNDILCSEDYWLNWFVIHKRRVIRKGNGDVYLDLQVSHKIMCHLRDFLNFPIPIKSKTQRLRHPQADRTRVSRKNRGDQTIVVGKSEEEEEEECELAINTIHSSAVNF